MKKTIYTTLLLVLASVTIIGCSGDNPKQIESENNPPLESLSTTQDEYGKTITFDKNQTINQYTIKADVSKVVINKNITLKGSFKIENRSSDLTIEGQGDSSVLQGNGGRNHGIEANSKFTIYLKSFKSLNPTYFHMRLIQTKIVAENVSLVDTSGNTGKNADGFSGAGGSTYNNCYVSTWDDSFKIYFGDYSIKNTTIVHNKNGAPFQMGWDDDGTTANSDLTLENVTVISNDNSYNQGIFSWAGGSKAQTRNIHLKGKGLIFKVNSGKKKAHLYQFGSSNSNKANNKTFIIYGGDANTFKSTNSNTINKNGSSNNKVVLK